MTRLSVNINKVATLRNARGGNNPDVLKVALDCERFGAQGITVHPRPDERHIRRQDVRELKPLLTTEFNIEGNPISEFINLVLETRPTQVTLVPDGHDQITSNHGWDTRTHLNFLTDVTARFRQAGIRVSIFVGADEEMVAYARRASADRALRRSLRRSGTARRHGLRDRAQGCHHTVHSRRRGSTRTRTRTQRRA